MKTGVINLLNLGRQLVAYERKLADATGDDFNLFEILRIGHYEVKTHSPMIAELLDPSGRHRLGDVFLKLFIDQLNLPEALFEASISTRVDLEIYVGLKTEQTGGRIDILLTDSKGSKIAIENKIYAADQENQLDRYASHKGVVQVVYLTLDGSEPEEIKDTTERKLRCISYRSQIIPWLESCRKETSEAPFVRESIAQYINLVKRLTGQNPDDQMNHEISKTVVSDAEILRSYFALKGAESEIYKMLFEKLEVQLEKVARSRSLELKFTAVEVAAGERYQGFYFTSESLREKKLDISFSFQKSGFGGFGFGISFSEMSKEREEELLRLAFVNEFADWTSNCNTDWWVAWADWPDKANWAEQTFLEILSADLAESIAGILDRVVGVIESVESSTDD